MKPTKVAIKSKFPWRAFFDTPYLNGSDPILPVLATIESMRYEDVKGTGGKVDSCLIAVFEEEAVKPMIFNKTNSKVITELYNTDQPLNWVGRTITLICDPNVRNAHGEVVGGVRIKSLPEITSDRFSKLMSAIKNNQYTVKKAFSMFNFTLDQIRVLDAV